jgi:hypothetical protein
MELKFQQLARLLMTVTHCATTWQPQGLSRPEHGVKEQRRHSAQTKPLSFKKKKSNLAPVFLLNKIKRRSCFTSKSNVWYKGLSREV